MNNNDYPTDDQNDRSRRSVYRLEFSLVGLAGLLSGFFLGISLEDKRSNDRLADEIIQKDDAQREVKELKAVISEQQVKLNTDEEQIGTLLMIPEQSVNVHGLEHLDRDRDGLLYADGLLYVAACATEGTGPDCIGMNLPYVIRDSGYVKLSGPVRDPVGPTDPFFGPTYDFWYASFKTKNGQPSKD